MKHSFTIAAALACGMLTAGSSLAQTSTTSASGSFTVQGCLKTSAGTEIADGAHNVTLKVYDKTTGQLIHSETDVVTTSKGEFVTTVGDQGGTLTLASNGSYELGISVDNQAEFAPRLIVGSVPNAITSNASVTANTAATANVALNANAVGGFRVDSTGLGAPGTIVTLNSMGKINPNVLSGSLLTSLNGQTGNVRIIGGGDLSVTQSGDTISLGFSGTGAGGLNLPFNRSVSTLGSAFSLTNSTSGSAGSFTNTSTGSALSASGLLGSAITATNTGTAAAITTTSTTGAGLAANSISGAAITANSASNNAITATTNGANVAALKLQNTSTSGSAELLTAINATGGTVLDLDASGLDINGNASGSADAVLSLKNTANNGVGSLLTATNAAGTAVLDVASNGSTSITSSGTNALSVTANGTSNTAINATSNGGTAINAATNSSTQAALRLSNAASDTASRLITAVNGNSATVLSVGGAGNTTIRSTAGNALDVATTVAGGTALKINGGLSVIGAAGTGTVTAGNLTQTVNNAYVKSNSIILLTVNSAAGAAVPVKISSQSNGSFTVALISAGSLISNLDFNYLIINQ